MKKVCDLTKTEILKYTLILGIAASFSHFAYDLSGGNLIVGLFNPVNESVWEHLKFMFFPFLIWWIAIYKTKNKNCRRPLNTWIESAAISLLAAPLSVVLLYYSYTGAFGIESLVIDVLLVFICYFISLSLASHLLKYLGPNKGASLISLVVIVVIFIAFIVFTFNPPDLPIFYP